MGLRQVKVYVNELTVGMFVSGLDRPWIDAPFSLQGFYIRSSADLEKLRTHCNYVYIDTVRGRGPEDGNTFRASGSVVGGKKARAPRRTPVPDVAPLNVKHDTYSEVRPLRKEISKAQDLHKRVHLAVGEVFELVGQTPRKISFQATRRAASAMVDSVIRNPDAFSWLSRVRDKDEHTYSHAVRSAVWAILLGRHIGLSKSEMDILALGVLLKDVGKTQLPPAVLKAAQRSPAEQEVYEQFVTYSVDILRGIPDVLPRVISVVKNHCERVNGSGFPRHLRGDKIPLLGKIAGIVTFYDEVTNPRGRNPLSPSKAVARLYEVRNVEFQEELVVEFIRAIGLYPTGTLVELSTGEVAAVVEQNPHRRLKPKVMVITNSGKSPLVQPVMLDLAEKDQQRQKLVDSGKFGNNQLARLEIVQDLEPGAYGLNTAKVHENYLATATSGVVAGLAHRLRKFPRLFGSQP